MNLKDFHANCKLPLSNYIYCTYSWHKSIEIGSGREVYGHDVTDVAVKGLEHGPALHVPEGGGGVPGAGQHLVVRPGEEAAAGVAWQLWQLV